MGAEDVATERQHCCGMKYRASSKKHSTQSTEDDLEILSRILSIFTIINSSLINTRDWAFYVWTSLHTCRVHTAPDSQIFGQFTLSVRRGPFNPHLLADFTFLPTREDQLPSAQISEYLCVAIRGVFRGFFVRRRRLIFVYLGDGHWRRFELAALARRGQEVEFREETKRQREN